MRHVRITLRPSPFDFALTACVLRRSTRNLVVFPSGDVGATRTLGGILGRVIEPPAAGRIAARFAPFRGMHYFCMLGYVLGAPC